MICDHYVFNKRRSQFVYIALKEVNAIGLRKKFLHKEVLPKYKHIAEVFKRQARERYELEISRPVNEHRKQSLEDLNRRSAYKFIAIDEKEGEVNESSC